jgi:hypothetical protein
MNKKWKAAWALFTTLIMLGPVTVSTSTMAQSDEASDVGEPSSNFAFTDKKVAVFTGHGMLDTYSNRLNKSTSHAKYMSALSSEEITRDTIVMIDQTWIDQRVGLTYGQDLKKLVLEGIPLIIVGSYPYEFISMLSANNLSTSFPEDAQTYGYYRNPATGGTVSYSITYHVEVSNRAEMLIGAAYNWAVNRIDGTPVRNITNSVTSEVLAQVAVEQTDSDGSTITITPISTDSGDWGAAHFCEMEDYWPEGWVNVVNAHYKLIDSSWQYDFWLSDLWVEEHPYWSEESTACSDLKPNGNVAWRDAGPCQKIIRYGPGTTEGVSTATVSLSFQYQSDGGATIGVSSEWSYTVNDVIVHNNCETVNDIFYWWHDLNEDKAVGKDTYFANPGMITRIDMATSDGLFHIWEGYYVSFCHRGWWSWYDYKEYGHMHGTTYTWEI